MWLCPYGRLACSKRRLRPRLDAPCACAMAAASTISMTAARCILLLQSPACSGLMGGQCSSCAQKSVLQPWSGMKDVRAWRLNLGQLEFQTCRVNLGHPPNQTFLHLLHSLAGWDCNTCHMLVLTSAHGRINLCHPK